MVCFCFYDLVFWQTGVETLVLYNTGDHLLKANPCTVSVLPATGVTGPLLVPGPGTIGGVEL